MHHTSCFFPTYPWLVRKGMGCKSKTGKRRSSARVQRHAHEEVWDSGSIVGGWIVRVHWGHKQGAKQLPGEGDCKRGGERATIGTRCPQKLMT